MKLNIAFLLYTFGIVSLVIGIIQFINKSTLEAILSLVYSIVFFIGGTFYNIRNKEEGK